MILPFFDSPVSAAPVRSARWLAQNTVGHPLNPALRHLFRETNLPLVKYDPEFARWQSQFKRDIIAECREQLRRELEKIKTR